MRKAAVLVVDGYEESETVTIVDLLRRAGIECHTFGFAEQYVSKFNKKVSTLSSR